MRWRAQQARIAERIALTAWHLAAADAGEAYADWLERRDEMSFVVYRACADRADAAQDELARCARARVAGPFAGPLITQNR
jgi:hypothetical protein